MDVMEERPVHHVFNCETGDTDTVPLSDLEWAEHKQVETDSLRAAAEQAIADQELARQVSAHPDPIVRILAERAGLV